MSLTIQLPRKHPLRSGLAFVCALMLAGASACTTWDPVVIGPDKTDASGDADVAVDGADSVAAIEVNFAVQGSEGTLLGLGEDLGSALPKDDKYPDKVGFQVDVVVTTNAVDGAQLALRVDNTAFGTTQTVKDGKATFSSVEVPCSTNGATLEVTLTPLQGAPVVKYKTFKLDCSDACLVQLDVGTAACITDDVDPATAGIQHNVLVTSLTSGCSTLTLTGVDAKGTAISQTKALEPGISKATFLVTLSPDELVPYGSVAKLQAVAKDPGLPNRPSVPSAEVSLPVTNEHPVVTVTEPDQKALLTLLADADPTLPGIQTQIKGTATTVSPKDPGASVTVTIGTEATSTVMPADGEFLAPVSFGATGSYSVTIKATNGCGLTNEPPTKVTYQVSADTSALSLLSPPAGATLLAKDDLQPASTNSYQTKVTVKVNGGTPGAQISIFCRKAGLGNPYSTVPHATALLEAETAELSMDVSLSVQELSNLVTCELRDDAPNPSTSQAFDWIVALPPPVLSVASPLADPALGNQSDLEVVLQAAQLDGAQVTYVLTSASGVQLDAGNFAKVKGTAASGKIKLPADGTYTLTFDALDNYGNSAAANLASDPTLTVVLDTMAPELKFVSPAKDTLNPFDNPDTKPAAKGYQTDIAVEFSDGVEVCLTTSGGEKFCVVPLPGENTAVFKDVTLQAGANTLTATATDQAGNVSGPVPYIVTFVSDAPAVAFVQPTGNLTLTSDTQLFQVAVKKGGTDGAPVAGAVTEIEIDGQVVTNVAVVEVGPGLYQFTLTGLAAKQQTTVRFGAAAPGAEDKFGYTQALVVTYKSGAPSLAIATPANGLVLNLANSLCVAGLADCQTQIKLSATNVEDDSPVAVQIACGNGPAQKLSTTVIGGAATVNSVVLPDQSTCTISAQVTDAAGQIALADPATVVIDRTAPVFGALSSPLGKQGVQIVLVAADDVDGDSTNGLQANIQISLKGVFPFSKVTLEVTDDLGVKTSYDAVEVLPDVPSKGQTASFGLVSLPDGEKVKLVFTTADPAGNPASVTISAQITAAKPIISIGNPQNNAEGQSCTSKAQCGTGACYQGKCVATWNKNQSRVLSYAVKGVPAGGTIALCSNTPGVAGPACATAGYKRLATVQVTSASGSIAVPATLGDGLYTFALEASLLPVVPWVSSLQSDFAFTKQRSVLIDTVAPDVVSLSSPAAPEALAACLNEASQSAADSGQAGGKFTFVVKTSEEASVAITANGGQVGSATTTAKSADVAVTLAQEGTAVFAATAIDIVGNASAVKSIGSLLVDTQKPTGVFANPSSKLVLAGANLDVIVASSSADTAGQQTTLRDAGAVKGTAVVSGGQAVFAHTTFGVLSQGSHTLQAELRDLCGNSTSFATNPQQITVDTLAPTLTIATPAQAAAFADADDADVAAGGYQVAVTFGTADAVSWQVELAEGCDVNFNNCSGGYAKVAQGSVTAPGGNEPAVKVSVPFATASANYSVRVTATDNNGNNTVANRGFKVQLSGCLVSLQGLSNGGVYNTSSCAVPGANCSAVLASLTGQFVGPCGSVANLQFKKGGVEVSKKPPVDQKLTASIAIQDGDNTTLEVIALDSSGKVIASSGTQAVKADLTLPKAAFIAGSVLTVPTPAGGALNLVGAAKDLNGQAGHQIHLLLQSSDAGLNGGTLTKLERTVGSATSALSVGEPANLPVKFSGNDVLTELQYAVLAENATNTVSATVTDAAGNVAVAQIAVQVDWIAPAKVTLADFADSDLNARRPMARLAFAAVGDNGATGKATSYQVRYSAKPINTAAEFDAACDAKALPLSTIGEPKAAGDAEEVFVEGPDPRPLGDPCKFAPLTDGGKSAWYFAVAAIDAAGNRSVPSAAVSTTALRLRYANITLAAGAPADLRSRIGRIGDVNGDGLGDFTLGGGVSAPLCIVYGRTGDTLPDIDLTDPTGDKYPNYTCLSNPGGLGSQVTSGDFNGDGIGDLAAGLDGASPGNFRRLRVYLGKSKASISTAHALEVTNVYSSQGNGVFKLNAIGNFNGDLNAGKPVADLAVTSRNGLLAYDRVVVIPGNTSWTASAPTTLDLDNVSQRISNNVATIRLVDSSGSPIFGSYLRGVGNLLTDSGAVQYDDLYVAQAATPQSFYVIKGRPLASKGGSQEIEILLSTTGTNPAGLNDKEAAHIVGNGGVGLNAFGLYADVLNIDGDALPDLVVQHANASTQGGGLYWLQGSWIAGKLGQLAVLTAETAVSGTENLFKVEGGYRLREYHWAPQSLGNFADRQGSGGPFIDVVHGRTAAAPDGANNRVIVRLALTRAKSAIPNMNSLEYADIAIYEPSVGKTGFGVTTTSVLGPVSFAPLGDFNGDGRPDLVVGSLDSSLVVVY